MASIRRRPRGYFDSLFRPVTRRHVEAACRQAMRDGVPAERAGRSTFVRFKNSVLPAKYVLGLAYRLATGRHLPPDDYHGGPATARIISRLGLPLVGSNRRTSDQPRRNNRPRRMFVTVSVAGGPAEEPSENRSRVALMREVVTKIHEAGWKPEVILFPGGFFKIAGHLGPLDDCARLERLRQLPLSETCRQLARRMKTTLVAGIDGADWKRPGERDADWGDQLCVAWTDHGIVGVGRKIFPVQGDESASYTVYRSDFATPLRRPRTASGRTALLCSCYDMYGCSESPRRPGQRTRNIYWLGEGRRTLLDRFRNRREIDSLLRKELAGWQALVRSADVGLAAVHHFAKTGPQSGKGYWQRHGVEHASRHLKGRLAFGAAHFEPPLPAPDVAVLAARAGRRLAPAAYFEVGAGGHSALVRRFDVS